jgi:hypothetical protein
LRHEGANAFAGSNFGMFILQALWRFLLLADSGSIAQLQVASFSRPHLIR